MVKIALYCSIVLIFLSCGQEKKETILDMVEILPQSIRDYSKSDKDTVEKVSYAFNTKIADEIGVEVMEIDSLELSMFPDRFEPLTTNKLTLHLKEDQISYCQWSYKDSVKTMNAFYNWIDCFGENCKSIKYNETVNFQKDNFVLLVSDTSITYISSALKLNSDDWLRFFELEKEIVDWKIFIQQGTKGKAFWFKVIDGEKVVLPSLESKKVI